MSLRDMGPNTWDKSTLSHPHPRLAPRGSVEAPANRAPRGQVFVHGVIFGPGIKSASQTRTLLPQAPEKELRAAPSNPASKFVDSKFPQGL